MDISKINNYLNNKLDIKYLNSVDSTNTYLMNSKEDIDLVIASNQTNGKGRYQNSFCSYEGGLYFSLKVKLDDINIELMNIKMVLSVYDVLKEENINADIKWLNDIYYNNKKVCGILCENSFLGKEYQYSAIGVGLNIYKPKTELAIFSKKATHIFDNSIDLELLISRIINNFYDYLNDQQYINRYRDKLNMINKKISIDNNIYTVIDILEDGRLYVKDENENIKYLNYLVQNIRIIDEY